MKKKVINSSIFAAVCIFLSGCAASYKPLNPETASYIKDNGGVANVQLEYHHNLLAEKKNKKHHKKELKKGTQIIALKITTNTEADLEYNKNFQLYSNGAVLNVLPTETTHSQLKQQAGLYLLHLLWTFTTVTTNSSGDGHASSSNTEVYPVGLIIGPAVALGNMAVASSANKKFKEELDKYSIFNRAIKKGETGYFLIAISSTTFQPINLKIINPV